MCRMLFRAGPALDVTAAIICVTVPKRNVLCLVAARAPTIAIAQVAADGECTARIAEVDDHPAIIGVGGASGQRFLLGAIPRRIVVGRAVRACIFRIGNRAELRSGSNACAEGEGQRDSRCSRFPGRHVSKPQVNIERSPDGRCPSLIAATELCRCLAKSVNAPFLGGLFFLGHCSDRAAQAVANSVWFVPNRIGRLRPLGI
ncbi:hypothetical protein GA0061101_11092 [Rhizobium lusitanum]|uniref:Uncharacterized protein n=1 Tax=Rhizobium lusitanum TaxID=293958 RepID=A0A1C3WCK5_9HYPH|nr:hypothetical protein GA0061101_11092 [Rhizobium lusitanum]